MKQQIYSLRLSNKNQYGQIKKFLSYFSPNELSRLHSLTLIQIEQDNLVQLKSLLPSITQLFSFHLISPQVDDNEILSVLPKSNLRQLTLLTLRSFLIHTQQRTLITHLTISHCSLEQLSYQLFPYVPLLKYLNIEHIKKHNRAIVVPRTIMKAVRLNRLIIGQLNYPLKDFARLARQIPNLKSLTLSTDHNHSMINAPHWEHVIKTLLPRLNIFQFKFTFNIRFIRIIIPRCRLFYSRFWLEQHHWLTQILCNSHYLYFYTTPYLSNSFQFESKTKDLTRGIFKDMNKFNNVTNLSLSLEEITNNECSFHFPNVTSLKLVTSINEPTIESVHIESLKMRFNLSNIKHLDISTYRRVIVSGELIQILNASPQLTSITLDPNDLILFYENKQICQYVNSMIKKLNIYKYNYCSFNDLKQLKKFCQIFSNIEQLICNIDQPKYILFLIYRLANLSNLHVYFSTLENRSYLQTLFVKASQKFNMMVRLNTSDVSIWIDKKIN
jgi:hypothetical protein